jgi:hypothetical protein
LPGSRAGAPHHDNGDDEVSRSSQPLPVLPSGGLNAEIDRKATGQRLPTSGQAKTSYRLLSDIPVCRSCAYCCRNAPMDEGLVRMIAVTRSSVSSNQVKMSRHHVFRRTVGGRGIMQNRRRPFASKVNAGKWQNRRRLWNSGRVRFSYRCHTYLIATTDNNAIPSTCRLNQVLAGVNAQEQSRPMIDR